MPGAADRRSNSVLARIAGPGAIGDAADPTDLGADQDAPGGPWRMINPPFRPSLSSGGPQFFDEELVRIHRCQSWNQAHFDMERSGCVEQREPSVLRLTSSAAWCRQEKILFAPARWRSRFLAVHR